MTLNTKLSELLPELGDGAPTTTVGTELSTVAVALAALAVLGLVPSSAVPALMVMPTVPSPVQLDRVTVGVLVVPLLTTGVLQVTPEGLIVTPLGVKLMLEASVYVILKSKLVALLPELGVGELTTTVGAELSTDTVALCPLTRLPFPTKSNPVFAFTIIPMAPSPVQLESDTVGEEVNPFVTLTVPHVTPDP